MSRVATIEISQLDPLVSDPVRWCRSRFVNGMKVKRFLPNHGLQELLRRFEVVPRPVELSRALVVREFDIDEELLEVRMLKAVLHGVPLLRIKYQHLLEKTVRVGVRLWEYLFHRLLVSLWELPDVLSG